jgi:hypothetical protein
MSWPWGKRRRHQRRDEDFIWRYQLPERIEERCRHQNPDLGREEWGMVEQGLREWFLCCAWRDGEVLGMPSRVVDEAWHEFILDSRAYTQFCEQAFGEYLHHTPESSMTTPMSGALDATSRAWERSATGRGESVLWSLDVLLGRADPKAMVEGRSEGLPDHWREPAGGWGSVVGEGGGHHHGGGGGGEGEVGSASGGGEGFGGSGGGGDSGFGGDSGGGGGSDSGGGGGDSGGGGCGGGGGE